MIKLCLIHCSGERPYQCPKCDKAFNQKNALNIHMTKHTGDKPHRCPVCEQTFSQKGEFGFEIVDQILDLEKMQNFPRILSNIASKMYFFLQIFRIFGKKTPKYPSKWWISPQNCKEFLGMRFPNSTFFHAWQPSIQIYFGYVWIATNMIWVESKPACEMEQSSCHQVIMLVPSHKLKPDYFVLHNLCIFAGDLIRTYNLQSAFRQFTYHFNFYVRTATVCKHASRT